MMNPEERLAGELLESEAKPVERLGELVGPGDRLTGELVVEPRAGSGERLAQLLMGMPMRPPKEGSVLNDGARCPFCGRCFVKSDSCWCCC